MGNAAGKSADALREAVQVLLEEPLSGDAAEGVRGGSDEYEGEEEDDVNEEEVLLGYIFGDDSGSGGFANEKAFFEAFSVADATGIGVLQPENLKLLARKAVSNISRFMEPRDPGPSKETLLASLRVLTRVFPVILSEPTLRKWAWEKRSLPYLLAQIEEEEEQELMQRQQKLQEGDDDEEEASMVGNDDGEKNEEGFPVQAKTEEGDRVHDGDDTSREGKTFPPPPSQAERNPTVREGENAVDYDDGDVKKGQEKEEEEEAGEGGGMGRGGGDDGNMSVFTVCFASVALHAVTNLISFPGFAIDEGALDWDDYYTPIPDAYYGIRNACVIWAPGVAVTEQNMRQVTELDSNRIEALRLMTVLLSLPLFLDTPSLREGGKLGTGDKDAEESGRSSVRKNIPGVPLRNPLTALTTSRHLSLTTELFYSVLNLAVVAGSTYRGGASTAVSGGGFLERMGLFGIVGGGGGGGSGGGVNSSSVISEGGPQSLVEWSLQVLALLLRHGRPYGELLEKQGISIDGTVDSEPLYASIPNSVESAVQKDPGYNCHRRCVFMIHSDKDLDAIALGLLRLLNDTRQEKHRRHGSVLSCHPEALMILSAFVHENPRFVPRLAASEELARGTVVCLCHFLEVAVETMMAGNDEDDQHRTQSPLPPPQDGNPDGGNERLRLGERGRKHPLGEEVGLLVLASSLLLTLSEREHFMAMLVDTPVAGRGEFSLSLPEIEAIAREGDARKAPTSTKITTATTLIEVLLAGTAWSMAKAAEGVALAAPALAAVVRNACPFLTAGMRRQTADWLLDALEIHLSDQLLPRSGATTPAAGEAGSTRSSSSAVASILLEGLAAAVAFHHAQQDELVEALTKRYTAAAAAARTPPMTPAVAQQGQDANTSAAAAAASHGGIVRWLALRGGMLDEGRMEGGKDVRQDDREKLDDKDRGASLFADETWFRVFGAGVPWEGWAMRHVLWPFVSRLVGPMANGSVSECRDGASALMASARRDVLRPSGLRPPWSEEEGEKGRQRDDAAGDQQRANASVSMAAVTDPDVIESGLQLQSPPSATGVARGTSAVLNLSGEGAAEQGGDEQVEVPGIGGVVGVGVGAMPRLSRVAVVEEPWQSMYLWSVVFVRTAWGTRLFDSRNVRLFEVVDEEQSDDDQDMYEDTLAREALAAAMDSEDSVGQADVDNEDFEEGSFVLSGTSAADPPLDEDDAAHAARVAKEGVSADALV